jgi:uncharacterized protein (DUF1697 family)
MATFVSMIRGINVAGSRPLKMDALRALHEALGFRRVRTYLQSGNVVFEAPGAGAGRLGPAIERRILRDCGYDVAVAVRSAGEMAAVAGANPFLGRPGTDPRFLHVTFLVRPGAAPSLDGIGLPLAPGEAAVLAGNVVYVYCPLGYGTTKINNTFFERKLSTRATTRNWQTVTALERLARGEAPGA